MTDEQIIKALEWCGNQTACTDGCPLDDLGGIDKCVHTLLLNALDLINRQKAEIALLKKVEEVAIKQKAEIELLQKAKADDVSLAYQVAKTEAIKEFAERLKELIPNFDGETTMKCVDRAINLLVKEMTEDEGK